MINKKPEKIIYKNQKEVHDVIIKELKSKYLSDIKKTMRHLALKGEVCDRRSSHQGRKSLSAVKNQRFLRFGCSRNYRTLKGAVFVKFLDIKEAYLIGSLTNGNFGIYKEKYEGYFGSDIDIVAIPLKINKKWQYEGEFYNWHKRYLVGIIKIDKITHPIHLLIPFNQNISLFHKKARELKWKVEKLK